MDIINQEAALNFLREKHGTTDLYTQPKEEFIDKNRELTQDFLKYFDFNYTAIYKFEDDAISLADWVLRSLLQKEIRAEIFEATKANTRRKRSAELIDEDDFSVVQPQEALMSDRGDNSEIPQERNYHPGKYQVNLFDSQNSSKFEELGTPSKQS